MELHFRPRFYRDLTRLKGKKTLNEAIYAAIRQMEKAEDISHISGLKKLVKYEVYYRIKIKTSTRDDYRLGITIRTGKIWASRILPRRKFYKHFP